MLVARLDGPNSSAHAVRHRQVEDPTGPDPSCQMIGGSVDSRVDRLGSRTATGPSLRKRVWRFSMSAGNTPRRRRDHPYRPFFH